MNQRPPALAVEGVSVEFPGTDGWRAAVRDVSWQLAPGERLGMVGESGSGKTLSALAAVHLVPPPGRLRGGEVRANGRSLSPGEVAALRGRTVGVVLQEAGSAFNPVYTVGFQLRETIRALTPTPASEVRNTARELLRQVGLDDAVATAYPHQLSGGQLQRALITVALAGNPQILIADEPTTALDLRTQATILTLFRRLSDERGLAMLLISHDLAVVAGMVERIVVMYAGHIVEEGPTRELLERPLHPYTRLLLASIPPRSASPADVGARPAAHDPGAGCSFAPRCPLVRDSCQSHPPALTATSAGRKVRCPVTLEVESGDV